MFQLMLNMIALADLVFHPINCNDILFGFWTVFKTQSKVLLQRFHHHSPQHIPGISLEWTWNGSKNARKLLWQACHFMKFLVEFFFIKLSTVLFFVCVTWSCGASVKKSDCVLLHCNQQRLFCYSRPLYAFSNFTLNFMKQQICFI